ncbi:hypothetical protein PMIT1303_00066 [Prochlorococcus sp. MIT 1303]|nr:hypothetical protein PMIT1303_00066 [Prochlorococcus sp. MIT 1303]
MSSKLCLLSVDYYSHFSHEILVVSNIFIWVNSKNEYLYSKLISFCWLNVNFMLRNSHNGSLYGFSYITPLLFCQRNN